jgi:AraC-like DNA-binding protein
MLSSASRGRSLTEIASRYGFMDPAVFSRAFAAQYGARPSRYREALS